MAESTAMPSSIPTSTTLYAHCLCRATRISFTVPNSSLPLDTHFCHCSICRHTHGTLVSIHARIPKPDPATSFASMTAYQSSERVTRWFCATCGAQMIDRAVSEGNGGANEQWYVAASLVDAPEETFRFGKHLFVGSTGDGGLAPMLKNIAGNELEVLEGDVGSAAFHGGSPSSGGKEKQDQHEGDKKDSGKWPLTASCHCRGIQFQISQPQSPSVFDVFNPEETITPSDKSKWYALHDVCNSCRLASGCAINSWVFPLKTHLRLLDGASWPDDHVFGTGKVYRSSEGVTRLFCQRCGTKVAYVNDVRSEIVDVSVGLLGNKGREGVLKRGHLEWRTGALAFMEYGAWKGVLGALEQGLRVAT